MKIEGNEELIENYKMVRQVLSDESLNDRGFRVMNKSINGTDI